MGSPIPEDAVPPASSHSNAPKSPVAGTDRAFSLQGGDHQRTSSITSNGRTASLNSRHGFSGRPVYRAGPTGNLEITDEHSTDQTKIPHRKAPSTFSAGDRGDDGDWQSIVSGATTPTRRSLDPSMRPASMRGRRAEVPWIGTFNFEKEREAGAPVLPGGAKNSATLGPDAANGATARHESGSTSMSETPNEKGDPEKSGATSKGGEEDKDPNLVEFEENDPANPQNWPRWRKWCITLMLGAMTLAVTFASSVFSSAIEPTAMIFGVSTEVMVLGTSLFVLGFALGPICWGPISELIGRKPPLFFGYIVFAVFQVAVAVSQTLYSVMICRFFGGFFGSAPLAIVGGMLGDMWDPVYRGYALVVFAGATFIGPVCGPIVGSFVTYSYLGWRWTEWVTSFLAFFLAFVGFFVVPETSGPYILHKRAADLRQKTQNWALHAQMDTHRVTAKEIITQYLEKPFKMIFLEPILLLITIYTGLIYGILYAFFEVFPITFQQQRGLSPGVGSLPFIGVAVGVAFGAVMIIALTGTRYRRRMEEEHDVVPEERLVPMMIGSFLMSGGLFWFAWTSNPNITIWPQIVSTIPIGAGILSIFMQGLNYLIDVYKFEANSAIAANTFVRSAFGAGFPMFSMAMYNNLGVDWATSLLGFLCVALAPAPFLFYIFGPKIRGWSRFAPKG